MWKIIGLIESRGGDVEFLPEWAVGKPNDFESYQDANTICRAMQDHVEKLANDKLRANPGVGGANTAIRYMVLPALDEHLLAQIRGEAPIPQAPQRPAISFSAPRPTHQ